jgi:hypothetical protein
VVDRIAGDERGSKLVNDDRARDEERLTGVEMSITRGRNPRTSCSTSPRRARNRRPAVSRIGGRPSSSPLSSRPRASS